MEKVTVDGLTLEPATPTIVRVTWKGKATAAAMHAMYDYARDSQEELGGGVSCIVDAREATSIDREGRAVLSQRGDEEPWQRAAFVGVRFEVRVVLDLLSRAIRLFKLKHAEVRFFATEAEAWAWLDPDREA